MRTQDFCEYWIFNNRNLLLYSQVNIQTGLNQTCIFQSQILFNFEDLIVFKSKDYKQKAQTHQYKVRIHFCPKIQYIYDKQDSLLLLSYYRKKNMTTSAFYQTDFKPDYELFQEKISQLSAQKSKINKKQISLDKLQHELELIKEEIDDQGLQYDNSSIFVRYASPQELAQKKKSASDCCVHCGEEMKKTVQCQFCAEVFCKNCCWRKRVIPTEQHTDFRLCCEDCHQKYIKLFNNQEFYKEKAIYLAAIEQLERKYEKSKVKYEKKDTQVNEYRKQKQTAKIKQGNIKKALLDQEKQIKQLTELFQKTIQQKAMKLKSDQERRKRQQKQLEQQKLKLQHQKLYLQKKRSQQSQEQNKRISQLNRTKQEEFAKRQAEIRKQKEMIEKQRKQLSDSRMKQLQELEAKAKMEADRQADRQADRKQISLAQIITNIATNDGSSRSYRPIIQSFDALTNLQNKKQDKNNQLDFGQILRNIATHQANSRSYKPEKDQQFDIDAILKAEEKNKNNNEDTKQQKKQQVPVPTLKSLLKQIKQTKKPQEKGKQSSRDSRRQQKSQKSDSISVSQSPKLTMTQIKTMNINDLLSMKIPMNPSATPNKQKKPRKSSHPDIAVDGQQNSTTTQNQKMYQSLLQPGIPQQSFMVGLCIPNNLQSRQSQNQEEQKRSVNSYREEQQKDLDDNQKQAYKRDLLMRSSLISSTKKSNMGGSVQQKQPEYNEDENGISEPQKCSCEIM